MGILKPLSRKSGGSTFILIMTNRYVELMGLVLVLEKYQLHPGYIFVAIWIILIYSPFVLILTTVLRWQVAQPSISGPSLERAIEHGRITPAPERTKENAQTEKNQQARALHCRSPVSYSCALPRIVLAAAHKYCLSRWDIHGQPQTWNSMAQTGYITTFGAFTLIFFTHQPARLYHHTAV